MDIEFSEAADINVEVQALNLDGIKQNLLDYVQDQVKIDIDDSVDKADKSAQNAETYAAEAAVSATAAAAAVTNYYTKTEVNTALAGKASTSFDNLSADGQMIINSQNGTISNCVLEIPQNIKVSIASNVVTLENGSIITLTGSTYTTYTLTAAQTYTVSSSLADGKYYLFTNSAGVIQAPIAMTDVVSATSLPESGTYCYLTTDRIIYKYEDGEWSATTLAYPLGIIEMSGGVAGFAKDSNGNYMIFNGAGFIGQYAFIYPGIKMLNPMGLDDDGNLNSEQTVTSSLTIAAFGGRTAICCYNSTALATRTYLGEYKTVEEAPTNISAGIPVVYISGENKSYQFANNQWSTNNTQQKAIVLVNYSTSGTTVTDFTIRQPVRTATVEMLNSALGDVETLLATV